MTDENKVLRQLSKTIDLDKTIEFFFNELKDIVDFSGAVVYLIDEAGENLVIELIELPEEYSGMKDVYLKNKQPIAIKDTNVNSYLEDEVIRIKKEKLKSYSEETKRRFELWKINCGVYIPLSTNSSKPLGTVFLFNNQKQNKINENALLEVQELISLIYYQLKNALSYSRLVLKEKEVYETVKRNEKVLDIAEKIGNLKSLNTIYSFIIQDLIKLFGFDMGFVLMPEDNKLQKVSICSKGSKYGDIESKVNDYLNSFEGYDINLSDGANPSAFIKNVHYFIKDIPSIVNLPMSEKDKNFIDLSDEFKSFLLMPIRKNKKPIGMLNLYSINNFISLSEDDIKTIESLCSFFGTAIKNAEIYSNAEKQKKEFKKNQEILLKTKDELQNLNENLKQMSMSLDIDVLFDKIAEHLTETYSIEAVWMLLISKDESYYYVEKCLVPDFLDKLASQITKIKYPLKPIAGWAPESMVENKVIYHTNINPEEMEPGFNKTIVEFQKIKTILIIPVNFNEKVIGNLTLTTHSKAIELYASDISSIKRFASQISIHIRNSKLYEELKRRNEEIQKLNEISKEISMSLDFNSVFEKVMDYLFDAFGFEGCIVDVVNPDRKTYKVEIVEIPEDVISDKKIISDLIGNEFPLSPSGGRIAETILNNKISFFTDISPENIEEEINRKIIEMLKIKTVLNCPISIGEEVIGAFSLTSHTKSIYLTDEEMETVKRFVNQIAVIIRNSRLFDKLKVSKKEIENLNEISKQISMSLEFDDVFLRIVDYLRDMYGFQGCYLALVGANGEMYKLEKIYMPEYLKDLEKTFTGYRLPLTHDGGKIAYCIKNNKTHFITDINPEDIEDKIDRITMLIHKIKSDLIVPITIGEEVIGAFSLTSHDKFIYLNDDDIQSIKRFVNQIAIIIKNSKLYDEIEEAKNTLELKDKIISEDLSLAKKIQSKLISIDKEQFKDVNIKLYYNPLMEVGGDIYDIYELKQNCLRVFIADATGHGIQAALATMIIKTEYDKIKDSNTTPDKILFDFNKYFYDKYSNLEFFFTCFFIDINLDRMEISFSSAGHFPQLLIRNKKLINIKASGTIMGVLRDERGYTLGRGSIKKRDKILLFTDGIFEVFSEEDAFLGENGFNEIVEKYKDENLDDFIDNIIDEINTWKGKKEIFDDITFLGIEI